MIAGETGVVGWRTCVAGFLAALCAGCASPATDAGFAAQGARDTGTYPNLNVPPAVAAAQFDPYSLAAHNTAIRTAVTGQRVEGGAAAATAAASAAEAQRLRQLGATHGQDTLKTIEAR